MKGLSKFLCVAAVTLLLTVSASSATMISGGLTGTYYNDTSWGSPVLNSFDTAIWFDWGLGSPDASVGTPSPTLPGDQTYWSAKWKGWVDIPASGSHRFIVQLDDYAKIVMDGTVWFEPVGDGSYYSYAGSFGNWTAGLHPIEIYFYEAIQYSFLKVSVHENWVGGTIYALEGDRLYAVPAPGTAWLLAAGLTGLALRRRLSA